MAAATTSALAPSDGMKVLYTVEDAANGKHADIEWGNFGTYVGPMWDGNTEGPFHW